VNQIETNPFCLFDITVAFCKVHDIKVVAYSPLTRSKRLKDSRIVKIAENHKPKKMTPAQVMLRWNHQKGRIVIPKSKTPERIVENIDAIRKSECELSDEEMTEIDQLNEESYEVFAPAQFP